jgi:hypothetical protein
MRDGLIEWMEFMSPGKTGEDTWISRVKIEHHADHELVAWVEREAEEGAREFADRVYAIAENDAEAMGDGQQLYMLRIYRPGEDDDKWQIRRPLRILQPFPEQGQAAEKADHSLSGIIASLPLIQETQPVSRQCEAFTTERGQLTRCSMLEGHICKHVTPSGKEFVTRNPYTVPHESRVIP